VAYFGTYALLQIANTSHSNSAKYSDKYWRINTEQTKSENMRATQEREGGYTETAD
jgi:hypothetical protein